MAKEYIYINKTGRKTLNKEMENKTVLTSIVIDLSCTESLFKDQKQDIIGMGLSSIKSLFSFDIDNINISIIGDLLYT